MYDTDLSNLRSKIAQIDKTKGVEKEKVCPTLSQLFYVWIDSKINIQKTTRNNYVYLWGKYFDSYDIGSQQLKNITLLGLQEHFNSLIRKDGSMFSIRKLRGVLEEMYEFAIVDEYIKTNIVKKITLPKEQPHKETPYLTIEQQKKFTEFLINNCKNRVFVCLICFVLETGLRIGEVAGLTWDNINFKDKTIAVEKQILYTQYNSKYEIKVGTTKTQAGIRTIPMTNRCADVLHQMEVLSKHQKMTIDGQDYDFIFKNKNNNVFCASRLRLLLSKQVKRFNKLNPTEPITHLTMHGLRHSVCTKMIKSGMELSAVQKIMGHSSIQVTLNVYNHITQTDIQKQMLKFENVNKINETNTNSGINTKSVIPNMTPNLKKLC